MTWARAGGPGRVGGHAVGEVHEGPVERVEQHHAAGEQERQRKHGEVGQALDRGVGRGGEQHDLGGGVEPDAEDEAHEVELPECG
jgi:hypothetical protein